MVYLSLSSFGCNVLTRSDAAAKFYDGDTLPAIDRRRSFSCLFIPVHAFRGQTAEQIIARSDALAVDYSVAVTPMTNRQHLVALSVYVRQPDKHDRL